MGTLCQLQLWETPFLSMDTENPAPFCLVGFRWWWIWWSGSHLLGMDNQYILHIILHIQMFPVEIGVSGYSSLSDKPNGKFTNQWLSDWPKWGLGWYSNSLHLKFLSAIQTKSYQHVSLSQLLGGNKTKLMVGHLPHWNSHNLGFAHLLDQPGYLW